MMLLSRISKPMIAFSICTHLLTGCYSETSQTTLEQQKQLP